VVCFDFFAKNQNKPSKRLSKNTNFKNFSMKNSLLLLLFCSFYSALTAQNSPTKPFVLGEIRELDSKILGEKRTLNVYLPDGYSTNDTIRYPVIYLLDGSADEDFIHVAGLVQFCNFPWVKTLPPSIVVGVANVDRKRDFTYPTTIEKDKKDFPTTGGSAKFIAFIEQELQDFVGKTYKTNAQKTLIGQSLGGLLATEILFKKPHLFTHYALISPSLWWDNESLLAIKPAFVQPDFTQNIQIFLAVGNEGEIMVGGVNRLKDLIKQAKQPTISWHFKSLEDRNHATIHHEAVYKAFEWFKYPPQ
jgi:uncharacterized protein